MAASERTPYQVLEVPENATPEAIAAAYNRLVRYWNPATNTRPEARAQFKAVNDAYRALNAPAYAAAGEAMNRGRTARGPLLVAAAVLVAVSVAALTVGVRSWVERELQHTQGGHVQRAAGPPPEQTAPPSNSLPGGAADAGRATLQLADVGAGYAELVSGPRQFGSGADAVAGWDRVFQLGNPGSNSFRLVESATAVYGSPEAAQAALDSLNSLESNDGATHLNLPGGGTAWVERTTSHPGLQVLRVGVASRQVVAEISVLGPETSQNDNIAQLVDLVARQQTRLALASD